MGMDDYPDYTSPNVDVVSAWLSKIDYTTLPADYFTENYDDDDAEFNQFSADFRFGYYDHDIQETACSDDGAAKPLRELLRGSYAASYRDAMSNAAVANGYTESSLIWLMFNFNYDPKTSGVRETDEFLFLGVFPFDKSQTGG